MESNFRRHYFVIIKSIGILGLGIYAISLTEQSIHDLCLNFLTGALFLFCSVMCELCDTGKRTIWVITEGLLALIAVILFPVMGIFFVAIAFLDILAGKLTWLYPLIYLLLFVVNNVEMNVRFYFFVFTFLILFFYQDKKIIGWYKAAIGENEQTVSRLKYNIENSNFLHEREMKQSRYQYENIMLEEKARISQALHDKLGHSINGSLYKLEAAKALMDKDTDKSRQIVQEVIDNLRGSMDEIRVILKNERPDRKESAIQSLEALCEECEKEYRIKTTFNYDLGDKEIPDAIWEVILDNTFEAVTNSLKHSGCDSISIKITVLGEVVRCVISDNGKGAERIEDGMGIQGMKKRVRNVKGFFDIESNAGFTINMILPITGKTA